MKKHLISAVLALSLLICLPLGGSAHPVPDESQNGHCSITVTMRYKGKPVSGGTVNLYKVGYVHENDGNYSFKPVTAVQSVVTEFEDIQSPDLAQKLAKQVDKLTPVTTKPVTIDKNGAAAFTDLDFGLYLVAQKTAASGYKKTAPFLVSVPYLDDGAYVYAVASDPKTELEREVKPTTPTTPHSSSDSGGKLAQTGQLWWPVPVLICAGLGCIVVGLFRRRRDQNEV